MTLLSFVEKSVLTESRVACYHELIQTSSPESVFSLHNFLSLETQAMAFLIKAKFSKK